jgi:hypothetical protein
VDEHLVSPMREGLGVTHSPMYAFSSGLAVSLNGGSPSSASKGCVAVT